MAQKDFYVKHGLVVGNVIVTNTNATVGNSSVNTSITSALFQVANSTATANLSLASGLVLGTTVANTTTLLAAGIVTANSTGIWPASNSSGQSLGDATHRWNLTGNAISLSSTATVTGNVTTSGNMNAVIGYFSGAVNAASFTTTGNANAGAGYFGGVVNATTFTTTGNMNAGSTYVTGGTYPAGNASGQALGDGTHRWVITGNSASFSTTVTATGNVNSSGYLTVGANSYINATTHALIGATAGGLSVTVANNSGNVITNPLGVTIANSGGSISIVRPSAAESGGNYFLKADGVWTLISATPPGGSDTYVQYNSSGSLAGNAGFTYVSSSNTVTIANTILAGGASGFSANSSGAYPNSNSAATALGSSTKRWIISANSMDMVNWSSNSTGLYPGGNGSGYVLGSSTTRWVLTANSGDFSGGITLSGGSLNPVSNSTGTALGATTARWVITANSVVTSGNITATGNVNGAIGYFTGLVNAASFTTTGNANTGSVYVTGGVYPTNNTSGIALGSTTNRFNLTGNTITVTGTITASGNITGSNVNGAIGYFSGLVNASAFTTTGNANAGSHYATSGGVYPINNTSGIALGSATGRFNLTGNSISVSSTITATGNVTTSGNVNAAAGYYTGLVNASTFTTTGSVNGAAGYFTSSVNATTFTTTGNINTTSYVYVGANVYCNTTIIRVGNASVNSTLGNNILYIGNTTSNTSVNSTGFYVGGSPLSAGATLNSNNTVNDTFYIGMSNTTSGTWTNAVVSDTKMYFNPSTGELSATDFNSLSDAVLKQDLSIIEDALNKVDNLNGYSFTWKDNQRRSAGIIAQEVKEVLPEIVTDKNTVNYNGLIGLLIQAIKELKEEVKAAKCQTLN